jgi:hypothetical protein
MRRLTCARSKTSDTNPQNCVITDNLPDQIRLDRLTGQIYQEADVCSRENQRKRRRR